MLMKYKSIATKIVCCVIAIIMLLITVVACNDNNNSEVLPEDEIVEKKSLIQQRNEVYETEGKAKWYDYEGKEYSFGKLGMSTKFNDPRHRHYDWEDLLSYEMTFSDKQEKTSILNNADLAVKNYWHDEGQTVETAVFSDIVITFVELTDEYIAEAIAERQDDYDDLSDMLNRMIESEESNITDEELDELCDFVNLFSPQKTYGGETLDSIENDMIQMTKTLYMPISIFYCYDLYDLDDKVFIPYVPENGSGIENSIEDAVVCSRYVGGIVLEYEITAKDTDQKFCMRMILKYSSDYFNFVFCDDGYKNADELSVKYLEFAIPAINTVQPIFDEVVNGYLLEEFGVVL